MHTKIITRHAAAILLASLLSQGSSVAQSITPVNVTASGNITADGWGWFKGSSYLGGAKEFTMRSTNGVAPVGNLIMEIGRSSGRYYWRDAADTTAKNKMYLDEDNNLVLYRSNGTTPGITLNAADGRIDLNNSTTGGIYAYGVPIVVVGSSGSTAMTVNSLTVAGDSFVNGLRIGKGGGGNLHSSAFGLNSLDANTSGIQNSGFGKQTLLVNTTGSYNDAFGAGTLRSNTTGSCNVGIGTNALLYNVAGSHNIGLGTAAGAYIPGLTALATPSNSIFIGSYSQSNVATVENTIVIGTNAVSKGSNTTVIGNAATTETHLMGAVILAVPQGDISMGAYAN